MNLITQLIVLFINIRIKVFYTTNSARNPTTFSLQCHKTEKILILEKL